MVSYLLQCHSVTGSKRGVCVCVHHLRSRCDWIKEEWLSIDVVLRFAVPVYKYTCAKDFFSTIQNPHLKEEDPFRYSRLPKLTTRLAMTGAELLAIPGLVRLTYA